MPKAPQQIDVLVLGQHPAAYLAAAMLTDAPKVSTLHATIPGEMALERLVIVNPEVFALHKPLEKLKKKLDLTQAWGAQFLGDDVATRGEWRSKSAAVLVGTYCEVRKSFAAHAKEGGVKCVAPKSLVVRSVDETGLDVELDTLRVRAKAMLLAGEMTGDNAKLLGLPECFATDVMRRYSILRLRGAKWGSPDPKPLISMSLNVGQKLSWAWMLVGKDDVQLAVEQPLDDASRLPPAKMMQTWAATLVAHGVLKGDPNLLPIDQIESIDLPAAGALAREVVANRTLLFGPAAGFYTACMEDVYPNCWSATFAVAAIRRALAEKHLQDALQGYRQEWGTTLGEYLRGPQQNLRFLLPLVYRNPVMTARMAESILLGKSVVR